MRFSYTIFKDDGTTDQPVRVNLTTRHEEISADAYTHPFYVEISDNLYTGRPPTIIKSADEMFNHVNAWCNLLATVAGLTPIPDGVSVISPSRKRRTS